MPYLIAMYLVTVAVLVAITKTACRSGRVGALAVQHFGIQLL
ncbi:hypothetical protein [Oleiagrimonas sp. MCCC 1A03011]|nr:hypothetical protein [Oleiagrimonas sp. MCCC 1A03011]